MIILVLDLIGEIFRRMGFTAEDIELDPVMQDII